MENAQVLTGDAVALLSAVSRIGDSHTELAARRKAMLLALAELIGADSGFWSWGRGWPGQPEAVAPIAMIDFGLDSRQRTAIMEWALDADFDREFGRRVVVRMNGATRATTTWEDIFSPEEWADDPFMRRQLRRGSWGSWLHSVRYSDRDTWSSLFLLRAEGGGDFGRREAALSHLVLDSVPWMHSTTEESLPPGVLAGLTPRRRTVMLMILDGMSRKAIASHLDIAEDTVGDHIKAIYSHFGVGGASQLAALFLRNQ